ncbi:MAG: AAA family ATPase [Gemmatimonadota bacterium]|nr:AAA family ATPase [Gemmatimonadota bacterium]
MINVNLSFSLPKPWKGQTFETRQIGPINYLVGPNGSGKSQFANELARYLPNPRLLNTDRLRGMEQSRALDNVVGRSFDQGYARNQFSNLKQAGTAGSGIDTIVLLEERVDLRIQVEATLSHLFEREIILEWDSGNLVGRARRTDDGDSYRLDREECHGIKELLILLTHLYDDNHSHLIIDEPELNLHPQYQTFFMQEVRKIAGDPHQDERKKIFFLITHSPFILDLRSEEDLRAVLSFDLDYSVPKQVNALNRDIDPPISLMQRLNAHHKQLFFSDNPIFVEGIHDARIVESMMEARGVSVSGAGSCVIDAGGSDQVNHYLNLCRGLDKQAYFLYDLDSLFRGSLRSCIKSDESIQSFLATAGLGGDFAGYCGKLEQTLTDLIDHLLGASPPPPLDRLKDCLAGLGKRSCWKTEQWAKARTAVVTALSRYRDELASVSEQHVVDVEGRLRQIVTALKEKNIFLLPGGTIERYLPCYKGDDYELAEDAKRRAIDDEIRVLATPMSEADLSSRYGELYEVIRTLPSKAVVDIEPVLRNYLSDYIHELQKTVVSNPNWSQDQIQAQINRVQSSLTDVFSIIELERSQQKEFNATIEIAELLSQGRRLTRINHHTRAGMGDFEIVSPEATHGSAP